MTTKLTLTIDDTVIESAKKYARQNGKSLSDIVENYLKSVTSIETDEKRLSSKVTDLLGVIQLPEDFDHKKELGNILLQKYK